MFQIKMPDTIVECKDARLLSSIIQQVHSDFLMPCAGNRTCGKCRVKIISGAENISKMEAEEEKHLTKNEISSGLRLACFATAFGDCEISMEESSYKVHTDFNRMDRRNHGNIFKEPGFAVDIGTTTVVSYFYENEALLSVVGEMNAQGKFGADVISRIDYTNRSGESKLHFLILNQLSSMFQENIRRAGNSVSPTDVKRIVITGNTTMLHFLMDYPAGGIAVSPFTPYSLFGNRIRADELFPDYTNAELILPGCVSAYVGADVVCSVLASGMIQDEGGKINLLADIGTNGEMALYCGGKLYTCSTAAGPAFEGAGIKMGMAAKSGAVTDLKEENGGLACVAIDGADPIGICGTGLINVLSFLLRSGLVDETGAINEETNRYQELIGYDENDEPFIKLGDSEVILTGRDIRQLQLAKAAIHAGILTLCHACEIDPEQVDTLFLCGGFGSVIDPQSAAMIGLIPKALASKVVPLGNAAGQGASMMLQCEDYIGEASDIAANAVEIPLSTSSFFMDQYVEQMMF